jgi:hypothetical protein
MSKNETEEVVSLIYLKFFGGISMKFSYQSFDSLYRQFNLIEKDDKQVKHVFRPKTVKGYSSYIQEQKNKL